MIWRVLPSPHFISQQATGLFGDDELKPLPAPDLVGIERCGYPFGAERRGHWMRG